MNTQVVALIMENRRIYAQLMSVREERKQLQSHLDIEIALCGSKLFHHNQLTDNDIQPSSNIFVKLVLLYEREQILIQNWHENINKINEVRDNEKKPSEKKK